LRLEAARLRIAGWVEIALVLSVVSALGPFAAAYAQSQETFVANNEQGTARSKVDSSAVSGWAAMGGQERREIFEIDRKIMLECIELARFSANFHQATNRTGLWRSWMYPLEQEAGTALSYSNTLTDLSQRARGLKNPQLISQPSQKRGLVCATIGQSITGTSSAIELSHNCYIAWLARREGFSPRKSEAFVADTLHTIDGLLDQREAYLRSHDSMENRQVLALQGKLLRHIRNQLLYGFKQWSISSRQTEWSENTFYAIDSLQAFAQFTSSILALKGFTNAKYPGPSAITVLVAYGLVTANPFIRTIIGRCVGRYQSWRLSKIFPQERVRTMEELVHDWDELSQVMAGNPEATRDSAAVKEISFLTARTQEVDRDLAQEQKKLRDLRRVADQQAISGPIIGLLSVARGTCATVSSYGFRSNRKVSNPINFAGRISQATGQTYSLLATPIAKIRSVLYRKRLSRQGKLPAQIFQARLKNLDTLEAAIRAAEP